jgi:hypothetical protein
MRIKQLNNKEPAGKTPAGFFVMYAMSFFVSIRAICMTALLNILKYSWELNEYIYNNVYLCGRQLTDAELESIKSY